MLTPYSGTNGLPGNPLPGQPLLVAHFSSQPQGPETGRLAERSWTLVQQPVQTLGPDSIEGGMERTTGLTQEELGG